MFPNQIRLQSNVRFVTQFWIKYTCPIQKISRFVNDKLTKFKISGSSLKCVCTNPTKTDERCLGLNVSETQVSGNKIEFGSRVNFEMKFPNQKYKNYYDSINKLIQFRLPRKRYINLSIKPK